MNITYRLDGPNLALIVHDLDPALHAGAQTTGYLPTDEGFVREMVCSPCACDRAFLDRLTASCTPLMEPLFAQAAGLQDVGWDGALCRFLEQVEHRGIDWWLVGSAALAVRGIAVRPGDIDLCCAEDDALRLQALLADDLVQPVQDSTGWVGRWFGRAFMGAKVEWLGGVNASADAAAISDFGPVAQARLETIHWYGYPIRVPPLDLMLAVTQRRGLAERAALIEAAIDRARQDDVTQPARMAL